MVLDYKGIRPRIGQNVFIAPTAVIIGEVDIHDGASIWYGTVVRGDRAPITIGKNANIQDNCTLHTDPGKPVRIGERASVGHNAVVHGCTLERYSLVGIGAVVLNGATVKEGSIVASGAVVKEGQSIGPYQLVAGIPAIVKKELPPEVVERTIATSKTYQMLAEDHRNSREWKYDGDRS